MVYLPKLPGLKTVMVQGEAAIIPEGLLDKEALEARPEDSVFGPGLAPGKSKAGRSIKWPPWVLEAAAHARQRVYGPQVE